ncbi:MAG: thioesterase family protein [Clostridiales bacterium]|nr:thioesterase family protein [Clostridiales bacterium]
MKQLNNITIGKANTIVDKNNTANAVGSGSLEVFATPMMVALMEKAAVNALVDFLDEGETTVGTGINITHVSASPIGIEITATAEVIDVKGREITFKLSVSDSVGLIGEGTHTRFVVDAERFQSKTNSKV